MAQDLGVAVPAGLSPSVEGWTDILGYEGLYEVSTLGRVRNATGRLLSTNGTDKDGYPVVSLSRDGVRHTFALHRIVCRAFNGEPRPPHREVAHMDGVRANCAASNLRWVGRLQNVSHKRLHGTHQAGERHPRARLKADAVREIRASTGPRALIASKHNISVSTVRDIRSGRRWQIIGENA